jgi:hypothetical protein
MTPGRDPDASAWLDRAPDRASWYEPPHTHQIRRFIMQAISLRAGRRPLARALVVAGVAALLGACAGETTAPVVNAPSRAVTEARAAEFTTSVDIFVGNVVVSPVYGATVNVAVTCSGPTTTFDVMVGVEQELKDGNQKTVLQGTSTFDDVTCTDGSSSFWVSVNPNYGTLKFEPGRATVKAWVVNQQPGVEPASVTRRVRMYADLL